MFKLFDNIFKRKEKIISNEDELYTFIINHKFTRTVVGSMEDIDSWHRWITTRVYFYYNQTSIDICIILKHHLIGLYEYICTIIYEDMKRFTINISENYYYKILNYLKSITYRSLTCKEDIYYILKI